ncbi:alpha-2-macroglobulin [Aurantibacter sp.]|uniref:alpha-2-macroglobulin family protein n=1 Tax=Aurantibacter sp. TaxID=2807103 RepID=UPI0035C84535
MKFKSILTLILICVFSFSCKKESQEPQDNIFKYREYVSYTTTGLQSVVNPIQVSLAKPVKGWDADKPLDLNLISILPKVGGIITAKNDNSFLFTPNTTFKADTEYTVTLLLDKMFPKIESDLSEYVFKFKTKKPNFSINTKNLQSYSREWQYLLGELKSVDVISPNQAKELISASQNNNDLKIEWNESNDLATYFEFKIDSIKREINDSEINVKWNGSAINADNKGENTIAIPGKNNFKIINVEVLQQPEQYLSINFSDPLKKEQNFDGLVNIQKSKSAKYVVDGNVLKVYPNNKLSGNLLVDVFQGIKNTDGYKLKTSFSETIAFQDLKPQVRLVTSGVFLPNSEKLNFNFEAVNLKKVDVRVIKVYQNNVLQFLQNNSLNSNNSNSIRQVGRRVAKQTITLIENDFDNTGKFKNYSIDLANFFQAEKGAIYRVELEYKKEYALFNCDVATTNNNSNDDDYYEDDYYYDDYQENDIDLQNANDEEREEAYWDNLTYNYKDYPYNWRERDNPCHEAYYNRNRIVSQNLIASNLGVIVKRGSDNTYHFAVSNILNTQPESDAKVTLYNYQKQELISTTTNADGFVVLNSPKYASFAIISKGKNTTYLKLNDGNSLSLSKFDVSGATLQKGLKGFLYTERGVWRPGDSVFFTFMLNDIANPLPDNHPVKLEVTDATGKLVNKQITTNHLNHVYAFTIPTNPDDKTGNWSAKVSVGGAKFYKTLKVETVKPNRLKLKINFEDDVLSTSKPAKGTLQVNWLHGAPAKNLRTEVKAKFSVNNSGFKNYKNYVFNDPTKRFNTEELTLLDAKVNEEGNIAINNPLKIGKNAPGMLNAQFLVRAFENGGDFSIDAFTMPYAPYESFVGLKSPKEKVYGSFDTDQSHTFDIATVDKDGKPIKRNNLEVKVYKIEWRWWWNSSRDNLSKYTSSTFHKPYMDAKVSTNPNGKASFKINVPDDEGGRYLIRVRDPKSGHATGKTTYFYKNWWKRQSGGDKEAAKMLVFSADKDNYNVGETATVTFPSGTNGRALVSVENGSEVLDYQWVESSKGETQVKIPITKEMAPNVFVNISLLQPHASTANDLPLRMYGLIPLMVQDKNTILEPVLDMPNSLEPEQEFTVKVSEKNNKAMTYTIALVEEGLLDLTRFKTPNPWDAFYTREALGVKTWDMFDEVIGAYSGSIEQVFAIGGDGNLEKGKNKKANRFKPVVRFLGPFTIDKGDTKSHKIKLPNYVGSVRTMVIAGDENTEAYGKVDKTTSVKKPLMVLASLPRKLSPGEKVTLPVTLFAMEKHVKSVTVSLKLSNGIKVVGENTQRITFSNPDEKMTYFNLDVSKAKGFNTIEVIAKGNGEKASYKVEIDVINANPITSKAIDVELEANANQISNFNTFGVDGTNSATVEFSTLPPMNFSKRMEYLIQYPHGCVEQTTSSVFPQLYLTDIFDIDYNKRQEITENIKKGIKRLGNFQQPNGGLSYWIGQNTANDWGTSYAGHFLIEAEKKGYVLPLTFKSNWLRYQKDAARNWRPSYNQYRSDVAQAYRLYTLALAGQPELAAMNRLREFKEISNTAKWRLAAAYALASQKEASQAIINTASINFKAPKYNYYTYGSRDRNKAMALETMVITKDSRTRELAKELAKDLSSNRWMSTQTTAYCLMSMAKMVNANGGKALDVSFTINGKSETISTKNAIAQRVLKVNDGENSLQLKNNKDNIVFVRVLNSGKLPLGEELTEQRGLSASIVYKDLKGNRIDISKLMQGQDFIASVTITNQKNYNVNDVALTQLFPSGWDIVNTRFTSFGSTTTSKADYTDIRDDRVNFYFDLGTGNSRSKTFNVMLNASYLGTYYLPGLQAEAMYDNDFLVRNKGQWIEVVK